LYIIKTDARVKRTDTVPNDYYYRATQLC